MVRRLLLLNGFATLGVILYHSVSWGFIAMFWWTNRYLPVDVPNFDQLGSLAYYALRGLEQLIIFAIPAFLFVSGYFIAFATGRSQSTIGWKLVGARIRNLLVPYFFWSVTTFIAAFLQGTSYSTIDYLRMLALGKAADPYYYIILLSQFYLLSPLIVPIAKNRPKLLLLVTLLVELSVRSLYYVDIVGVDIHALNQMITLTPTWFFPGRIFCFAFGVIAGFHLEALKLLLARFKWILFTVVGLLIPLGVLEWEVLFRFSGQDWIGSQETVLDMLYGIGFILCFLAFEKAPIPFSKNLGDVGSKSFGVYLVHSQVLELVARGIYHIAPWILAYQLLLQPLLVVFGLGVPLLLMVAVNRSPVRPVYHYVFG